jgi:hypothetical protein
MRTLSAIIMEMSAKNVLIQLKQVMFPQFYAMNLSMHPFLNIRMKEKSYPYYCNIQ